MGIKKMIFLIILISFLLLSFFPGRPAQRDERFGMLGCSLTDVEKLLGKPTSVIEVSGTSGKRSMPDFLVDYLNNGDVIVTAKVCRWTDGIKYREVCFKPVKDKWIAFGEYLCFVDRDH